MENKYYIAFDLGATSGRTILGTLCPDGTLLTEEITRFPNQMLDIDGHLHWNIFSLYEHIVEGLRQVGRRGIKAQSIGIDTWGVDIVCIAPDGTVIGLPFAYRDKDTFGSSKRFFENVMAADDLYMATGIQHMDFNTIFQLNEHSKQWSFVNADKLLFMPDALNFMLCGRQATEYTIATTGQIVDPNTRKLNPALLEKAGVSIDKFAPVVEPGTVLAPVSDAVAAAAGVEPLPVVAIAGHDTASAIAAIPATTPNFAYLSSGTWSLMGIETSKPVVNDITLKYNITNEGGVFGTIRLLKNITGMWIIEQCLKTWKAQGHDYTYPQMVALAEEAPAFTAFIDPDHSSFVAPKDMPAAIENFCANTGQRVPQTHGEMIRLIFESLAMKYRYILDIFRQLSETPIDVLHIIGGGSRNNLLNQFTCDAIGLPVIAGPSESSAIGNIMMQTGCKSLLELRGVVSKSVETHTFTPQDTEKWNEAYNAFKQIL